MIIESDLWFDLSPGCYFFFINRIYNWIKKASLSFPENFSLTIFNFHHLSYITYMFSYRRLMHVHSWLLFLIILSSIMKKLILTLMLKWNVIQKVFSNYNKYEILIFFSNYLFILISGMFRVNIHANVQYKDNKSILLVWNSFVCVKSFCGLSFGLPIIFHSGNISN